MILTKDLVFIVGAGASVPYGLPTGRQLVELIVQGTQELGRDLSQTLAACGHRPTEISEFHQRLKAARPRSIDRFIQSNPQYAVIGKRSIANELLPREQPKNLGPGGGSHYREDRDWLDYLQSQVLYAPGLDGVAKNRISFVTFNFDRVIEFSLFRWLVEMFPATPKDAARIIRDWSVIHVNGQLGKCPWLGDAEGGRDFQPSRGAPAVLSVFDSIKIIGEDVSEDTATAVRTLLSRASEVCILGFSFDHTNLAWLRGCGLGRTGQRALATRFGMTGAEVRSARDAAIAFIEPTPNSEPGVWDALTFLRHLEDLHEYPAR